MEAIESLLSKAALVEGEDSGGTLGKISDCAYEFPEARDELAEALEAYAQRARTRKERYRASSAAAEIRAIAMLETLSSDTYL